MPRPRKFPDYDPEKIMKELLEAVTELYESGLSLRRIGDELDLDPQKVRKLLCTANERGLCIYPSETADRVLKYYRSHKSVAEIMTLTGLSRASVQSYLPYTKVPYKETDISANAERLRVFRERNRAVQNLKEDPSLLWKTVTLFAGYPFRTVRGRKFRYTVRGGEMAVGRKKKTITRSTVETAYQRARTGDITGPKQLGVFGASYLFPVFVRLGILPEPRSVRADEAVE